MKKVRLESDIMYHWPTIIGTYRLAVDIGDQDYIAMFEKLFENGPRDDAFFEAIVAEQFTYEGNTVIVEVET